MNHAMTPFSFCRRGLRLALVCLPLCLMVQVTLAATVPRLDKAVELRAREQPVEHFLEQLFGQIDLPVRIADSVRGYVNGDFSKPAGAVLEDIVKSFQLTLYYDGAVVHVYPASEMTRSILPVSAKATGRIIKAAEQLGLTDKRNSLSRTPTGDLVVTGARRFIEQVEELAHAVQRNLPAGKTPKATYRVFRLKYAWADDVTLAVGGQEVVIPGVASLLRRLVEPGDIEVPGRSRQQTAASLSGLRGQGLTAVGVASRADLSTHHAPPSSEQRAGGTNKPARIVADSRLNALIVRDTADRMPMYESLIASLDVEPTMLEIEATIIDMDTDRLQELGINWRLQHGDDQSLFGKGSPGDGSSRSDTDLATQAHGGVVSLVVGDRTRFISRIRALETQGAARIVSKPHVITLSDVEAVLDTTSTFFVRVAGQEEVDLFNVSVGTTLRVTPHVFDASGRTQIKLLVNIEDGSASDRLVDSIPVIERSTINTQALIDGGESLLIGGLVREFTGSSVSKVPLLGDIPVLGALFRHNSKTSSRVERLFLITPRLTRKPGEVRHFSGPIMAGSESQIIATAPARFDAVSQALAVRDARYPVPNALPAGHTDATLSSDSRGEGANLQGDAGGYLAPSEEPSVRERLLGLTPGPYRSSERGRALLNDAVSAAHELPVESSAGQSIPQGWHSVPGAVLTAIKRSPEVAQPVRLSSPTDSDGWQEIR